MLDVFEANRSGHVKKRGVSGRVEHPRHFAGAAGTEKETSEKTDTNNGFMASRSIANGLCTHKGHVGWVLSVES